MIDSIKASTEDGMKKSVAALKAALNKLRTGRPDPTLLDHVKVQRYEESVFLNHVASVNLVERRVLLITPWDENMLQPIEKGIALADLGLSPVRSGKAIRVPIPPLTEERRREMIKLVRHDAESGRVSIRNCRRDANAQLKALLKQKAINEDEDKRAQAAIQNMTDKYIVEIEKIVSEKEKDLMEI